ncbi:hypothetical protein [Streptosporangium sandarakinum]|uniref:SCO4225 family membrane protein n=1 Tax=Streptosporangium sandarakinum TaxID=1260955 RepID=UPI0034238A1E
MLDRFHGRENGVKAATATGGYTLVLLVVGIVILIALLGGKDSVVLWPLSLLAFPLSLIAYGLFTLLPLDGISDEQRWIIPVVNWAFLLLAGLVQAWLLWLILRGPKSKR